MLALYQEIRIIDCRFLFILEGATRFEGFRLNSDVHECHTLNRHTGCLEHTEWLYLKTSKHLLEWNSLADFFLVWKRMILIISFKRDEIFLINVCIYTMDDEFFPLWGLSGLYSFVHFNKFPFLDWDPILVRVDCIISLI